MFANIILLEQIKVYICWNDFQLLLILAVHYFPNISKLSSGIQ